MPFTPVFKITPSLAKILMRIEAARQSIHDLPITPSVLATLRETARLFSTHYSTMIEGNRLTQEQVSEVIEHQTHFPGRDRDEKEVLGYYAALEKLERIVATDSHITESHIQTLHALVMAGGKTRVKPTPYRNGQNVIRDGRNGRIVYMPPEAKDVPKLMREMVKWFSSASAKALPCPLQAAIAHYQFATIHPYYDGNGRTARLLTTLLLHQGGYDLKGLYSLEEYYAQNLPAYYDALTVGKSHNYYEGRATSDITHWIEYFCAGMAESFENVKQRAKEAAKKGATDQSKTLRSLSPRQRKVLTLFNKTETITTQDIQRLFQLPERTARHWMQGWVESGFLKVMDESKRGRRYGVGSIY